MRALSCVILALSLASCFPWNKGTIECLPGITSLKDALPLHKSATKLPKDHEMDATVQVRLRDEKGLETFLENVYDPAHPLYRKFLTPEEFHAKFGPTRAQVNQVERYLTSRGLHVRGGHYRSLDVHGFVGDIEKALGTELYLEDTPHGPQARATAFIRPTSVPIESVHGLTTHHAVNHLKYGERAQATTISAKTLRKAYNLGDSLSARDQIMGVVELDGYIKSDIEAYAKHAGLPQPTLTDIYVGGYDGRIIDKDAQVEVTMDIQLMHAIAPDAKEIRVFATENDSDGLMSLWNEIANPSLGDKALVKTISCSWGIAERYMSPSELYAEHKLFQQMAAQGQTVFAAAGDDGAYDDGKHLGTDDPASQPYVVGVGGTSLYTNRNGVYGMETAWDDGGGGISACWPIPAYQKGLIQKASFGSTTHRNVPDVASNADPATGHLVYVNGEWQSVGGTSAAAPIWAAFYAIVNQARADLEIAPIGFLLPHLYHVASQAPGTGASAIGLHDVLTGNNGYYPSVVGFDNSTGWGSFDAPVLLRTLAE